MREASQVNNNESKTIHDRLHLAGELPWRSKKMPIRKRETWTLHDHSHLASELIMRKRQRLQFKASHEVVPSSYQRQPCELRTHIDSTHARWPPSLSDAQLHSGDDRRQDTSMVEPSVTPISYNVCRSFKMGADAIAKHCMCMYDIICVHKLSYKLCSMQS